jgi:hypothetical protein
MRRQYRGKREEEGEREAEEWVVEALQSSRAESFGREEGNGEWRGTGQ